MSVIMNTANEITNFMEGTSFRMFNPLKRLELVAFSSFLGEPTYYQPVENIETKENKNNEDIIIKKYLLLPDDFGVPRSVTFYKAANASLDFDFKKTLELAVRCRNEFMMRKSTAQLLAIAAAHPARVEFNQKNPKFFREILVKCWLLPSDAISCLDAWKALFGSKSKFPSFLKRAYEDRLESLSAYQQEKYRKDSISMVRLSHASKKTLYKNTTLPMLMSQGYLELDKQDIKWETHRSMGKTWIETIEIMQWKMPHMAALRNIRGFAASNPGVGKMLTFLQMLLSGVKGGKQFPFRYITAYNQLKESFSKTEESKEETETEKETSDDCEAQSGNKRKRKPFVTVLPEYQDIILEYLEKCLQMSIENYPMLEGNVISLSDNSGSAHGAFTSSYGKSTVADIGNLSALFTAYRASGRGVVGIFGDELKLYEVDKSKTLLKQYHEITELGKTVGGNTENGVWLFFKNAFQSPTEYKFDHWFCYSDMQVGHGGLYGNDDNIKQGFLWGSRNYGLYIDIHKCIAKYRMEINPKINTYMVQTAGYDNTILPESTYRGAILSGWTGNEVVYAEKLCKIWDELERV